MTTKKENYRNWDDLIFENRNKNYGAYQLRKEYDENLIIGTFITFSFIVLLFFIPKLIPEKDIPITGNGITPISEGKKVIKIEQPPSIERFEKVVTVKMENMVKMMKNMVVPVITKEQVDTDIPTNDEFKKANLGPQDMDGANLTYTGPAIVEKIEEKKVDPVENTTIFNTSNIEAQPEFPGGYAKMGKFLSETVVYPTRPKEMNIQGTVYVAFVVGRTGEITDIKIARGVSKELDEEAIRVIRLMPAWNPGTQGGKPVNVQFILPIKFKLVN